MSAGSLFRASVASFRMLPLANEESLSSSEACSMERVSGTNFYRNRYVVQFVPAIDGKSFSDQYRLRGVHADAFNVLNDSYGKDDEAVFYESARISADVGTFEPLNKYYAKDRDDVYYKGNILQTADVETFSVDENTPYKGQDKNTQYEYGCDVHSLSWKDEEFLKRWCVGNSSEIN
ncbi:MAG: DKNYY domain-containing protein, partial [Candidatus Moraniibacteriota bacterium]